MDFRKLLEEALVLQPEQQLSAEEIWQLLPGITTAYRANGFDKLCVELLAALNDAKSRTGNGKPVMILMKTAMGKGVDFMEGSHEWHGIAPNKDQLEKAMAQLEETLGDY